METDYGVLLINQIEQVKRYQRIGRVLGSTLFSAGMRLTVREEGIRRNMRKNVGPRDQKHVHVHVFIASPTGSTPELAFTCAFCCLLFCLLVLNSRTLLSYCHLIPYGRTYSLSFATCPSPSPRLVESNPKAATQPFRTRHQLNCTHEQRHELKQRGKEPN
jgi:hypothetical protein